MRNYNYICIEGTIGAGKTTLATKLADYFTAGLILEQFEDNAFLPKFYQNPERYAFPLELSFLAERFQQLKEHAPGANLFNNLTVSDYFLSKSLVFAQNNLKDDEYKLFRDLFDIMFQTIPKPDLLVYLYLPVDRLKQNILNRGRSYEKNIGSDYLNSIQHQYLEFLKKHGDQLRVLILDISDLDFVKYQKDFLSIVRELEKPISKGVHHQVVCP